MKGETNRMKFTQYFIYTRERSSRSKIRDEWIRQAIDTPIKTEVQSDGRIRKWTKIIQEGKYLRVILLPDGEIVHNAFFDRRFREEEEK